MFVWLNGVLVAEEEASVSVFDYGFLYGFGLFETLRAYHGRPFRLNEHLKRMQRSAQELGWLEKFEAEELQDAVEQVIEANQVYDVDSRIRITLTPGIGAVTADLATCTKMTLAVFVQPLPKNFDERIWHGLCAVVYPRQRSTEAATVTAKCLSYMENVLARQYARQHAADEAFFLNTAGHVTEGATSNLFCVRHGTLITPPPSAGLLLGITREIVLELAREMKLSVTEENLTPQDLLNCDEAFLTNSLIEVAPLTKLNGQSLPIGSVSQRIRHAYREQVYLSH